MNSSRATKSDLQTEKMIFQGRTEQLDWKKIASIDIDNLIQEGDATQLLDLIKPVTFCKADSEFDDGRIRIDPAFIKVFRISQLISEFLLASQEKSIEKLTNLEEKYNETEKEKRKLTEEMLHLKEMLTSAKKELKKRKEMLASTQNEMLGENNSDEYDQCPYCSKKFLRPGYLLAHIQRRHQGLPANPLYPSYTSGGASTVVCHHPHPPPLLPHNTQQQHSHQQGPHNGIYDSSITLTQTPHGQALTNHPLFPSVHTPSPSILYGSNQQLGPSNLSFSGSVTSLNNIPAHNQGNYTVYNNNAYGLGKRESFTQTAVNEKSSHLDLLLEENQNLSLENRTLQQNQQAQCHSSDNNTPDSLNQLPPASIAANLPLKGETLMRPSLSTPPSPLPSYPPSLLVDGSRSHPTADVDHGGGDAVTTMVGASTLINRELLEAEKLDVLRMQNDYKAHWGNLEEEKVVRDGTEDVKGATIFENTITEDPTRFSINAYQSHLKEEGEVTKSPADVINQPQIGGDSEKRGKEFEELKRLLQASVQGELKSLISRLESQEQFWQDKLGSLQQDHERQIQQLRQELQIQNGATQNNNRTPAAVVVVAGSENGDVMANDKFHVEREIGDGENDDNKVNVDENNGNVSPPSGIILVESKKNHVISSNLKNTQFKSPFGAPRHIADGEDDDSESVGIPVAKPRKSKAADMEVIVPAVHESHSHSDTEHMSSISTKVNVPHRSTTQHPNMHRQHDHSSSAEPLELESYSEETNPEFLTVIQPEEFHEGKHGNSIVPHSSDTGTFAANKERSQRRYQHPLSSHESSPVAKSGLGPEMNKSGSTTRAEEKMTTTRATKDVGKSDEGSDFTLSESVDDDEEQSNGICNTSPQKNDRQHKQHQHSHPHLGFSNHPGGKSSVKQTPVKKKYIFDANARKLVEVSPEDEEDDENEQSDNNDDLNNASSCDEGGANKRSQSQLDLVRAKTIMELERNIADIGLNPESTAIGMEEMKRALRHLKLKRQDSKDQIHDYDKFDEERNAVKTFAKFEATKSSIDRKLDAISQSSKKSQQSSLKKILTAVKSSGKNFRKRVASAVKKKHKSEQCSDDEEGVSEVEKRKRKPSSAPPLKTTFFSKARWTRKKKSDSGITKNSKGKDGVSDKKAGEMESTSDMSTEEESEEEVELPEFMENSNKSFNLHRRGSSSRSRSSERRGNSSHHNSTRSSLHKKGSSSRPKSSKHLKRLNSSASGMQKSPHFHHHQTPSSSAVTADARKSSESSPFSNVDDYDDVDDVYENNKRVEMGDNNSPIRDNGKAELFGSHSRGTKTHEEHRQNGNKDFVKQVRTQKPHENTSSDEDDDDDKYKPNKMNAIEQQTGRLESQVGKNRKGDEDSLSSESQSEDDWDESFATSNEILAKAKSSGVLSLKGSGMKRNNENDSHNFENNDHFERKEISTQQRPSSGNANTIMRDGKKWNNEEMSDIRLRQIKQYVSKSKKEVSRDETSFSEEDSQEDYDGNGERKEEKGVRQSHYSESKQNPPRERKIAFSESVPTDFGIGKELVSSRNTNPTVQKWATSIESGHHGQQQLQSTHSNASSPYNLGRSNQISSYKQDAQISSNMKVSGFSSGDPQFGFNEGNSKVAFDDKQTKGNFDLSKSSWKDAGSPLHLQQQRCQFLTSTPASATSVETNAREMSSGQSVTAQRRQRLNSFDDMDDLEDLMVLSDDEDEELTREVQQKQNDGSAGNRQNVSTEISSFRRKNASGSMLMQPTNHHHLSGGFGGLASLRSRADAQNKLLQDGKRGSTSSRNSWDSQK